MYVGPLLMKQPALSLVVSNTEQIYVKQKAFGNIYYAWVRWPQIQMIKSTESNQSNKTKQNNFILISYFPK